MGTFALVGICSTIIVTVLPLLWGPVLAAMVCFSLRFLEGGATITDYFEGLPQLHSGPDLLLIVMPLTLVGLIFLIVPGLVIFSMYLLSFLLSEKARRFLAGDAGEPAGYEPRLLWLYPFHAGPVRIESPRFFFFYVGLVFTCPSRLAPLLAYRDAVGIPLPL